MLTRGEIEARNVIKYMEDIKLRYSNMNIAQELVDR
jgi:hypothetical protein